MGGFGHPLSKNLDNCIKSAVLFMHFTVSNIRPLTNTYKISDFRERF